MRSVFSRVAMGLISIVSLSFTVESGLSADKAAPPRGVVYLQRSAEFVVPFGKEDTDCYRGPLLREMQRQAFLIAARDELGLTTRDAWLGDWMPTEGDNEPFEVVMFRGDPPTLEVRRGFYPAKKSLFKEAPKITKMPGKELFGEDLADLVDQRQWLIDAEALSRTAYPDVLRKSGFQGAANKQSADGAVPEEIENLLGEMTFTAQFNAVRAAARTDPREGESPTRLGALVRGYANLGTLTEFYWHPAHKVFKARALLYAQRMLARDGQSPLALWHRAYAFGLVGLHKFAVDDLAAAEKIVGEMPEADRPERPDWVDMIDAYCRFDTKPLEEWKEDPLCGQLSNLLRYLATEMSGEKSVKVMVALEVLPNMPECYRINDGVCSFRGVRSGHRANSVWFGIAASTLYLRVKAMSGLTGPVADIVEGLDAFAFKNNPLEEFKTRGKLIHTLLDTGRPQTPAAEENDKPSAAKADVGEPSLATLGLLIREFSFIQVWRMSYFQDVSLRVAADQFIKYAAPLVADHPYAAFIGTFAFKQSAKQKAWKKLQITQPDGLELQQSEMYSAYYADKDRNKLNEILRTHGDLTAHDVTFQLEKDDVPGRKADALEPTVFRLLAISPFSPYARGVAIEKFSQRFSDKVPQWEKTADRYPRLCKGLARKYAAEKRWEDAAKWARTTFELCPDKDTAIFLAATYWRQGKKDQWVAALDEFLNYPDYDLSHARVCRLVAQYYMQQKKWEKAMTYAGAAADTYSGWGMNVAADCFEGMQKWEESEKLRKNISHRYATVRMNWYYYCRRTGHGQLKPARELVAKLVESEDFQNRFPKDAALFYMLDKQPDKATKVLSQYFQKTHSLEYGIQLALLQDELGYAKVRDETLAALITFKRKPGGIYNQEAIDGLVGLAKMIDADLKAGGKGELDLAAADRTWELMTKSHDDPPSVHDNLPTVYYYLLGRYLSLHGKADEAVKYWKKCLADTEVFNVWSRSLAGAALCDRGIKPESYKELWEKPQESGK